MLMGLLQYLFAPAGQPWYAGSIWGNIFASVLTGAVVVLCSRSLSRLVRRQHRERIDQQNLHHTEVTDLLAKLHAKIDGKE